MKKFIAVILLAISMLSFFILYNDYKEEQIFNMKNIEHHLKNSYEVVIPTKINILPRAKQYEHLLSAANGGEASIYFARIDQKGGSQKIIKYIYTQDNKYMDNFEILEGRKLDKSDMDTHHYLSTKDNGDPNQIGVIAGIGGMDMEIRTLQNMLDDGFFIDGECTVTVSNGLTIDYFADIFKSGIDSKLEVTTPIDIGNFEKKGYLQVIPLLSIFILLILYDILISYKKIAIEKMLGFSLFDIWKKRILKIIIIQISTIFIATITMSVVLFKDFNILYIKFYKYLVIKYIMLIIITVIIASIPFIYTENIKILCIIKNKKNIKEIIIVNKVVEIILCVLLVFLINIQFENYDNIKKAFDNSCKQWDEASKYRVLRLNRLDFDIVSTKTFTRDTIEVYKYFNKKGAILAAFGSYTGQSEKLNADLGELTQCAVVNPNYLKSNPAYDIEGNMITVSEDNKNLILIVPDKYKDNENEIRGIYGDDPQSSNNKVEIIWMKSGQRFFSYNFSVNVNDGNHVKDPILRVSPENGSFPVYNTQVFNIEGNPFKVRIEEGKTDDESIMPILDTYGFSSYGVQINYANEQMASDTKDYKDMFKYLIIGIVSSLFVMGIIIVQNIQNFVEQYKVRLALRQLHGYSKAAKYRVYFSLIGICWLLVAIVTYMFKLASIYIILGITVSGCLIEILISLMLLSFNEKRKLTKFIKGGI